MTSVTLRSSSVPCSNRTSAARSRTQPGIWSHPLPTPLAATWPDSDGILSEIVLAVAKCAYRRSILRRSARSLASSYAASSTSIASASSAAKRSASASGAGSPTKQHRVLISSSSSSVSTSFGIRVLPGALVTAVIEAGGGTYAPKRSRSERSRAVTRLPAIGLVRRSGYSGREE